MEAFGTNTTSSFENDNKDQFLFKKMENINIRGILKGEDKWQVR